MPPRPKAKKQRSSSSTSHAYRPNRPSGGTLFCGGSSVAEYGGAPATDRAQGMEVLRRPAEGEPRPRCRLVDRAAAARHPAGGVRDRHGRAGRRRATRPFARRSAGVRRRDLRPAPGAQPDSSGGQRQPRRPHRGLALRPAHRSLRAPAGHGPPGRSHAHQRPHRGARFRSRHDRAAALHLHGFHRQRHGRDDRRHRLRGDPRDTRGGRRSLLAGAWLATHWLLRESAIWRDRNTEEVRGAQRDADYAYRLAVDPPASKELRLFGLAGWTIDRFIARRTRLHELQYAATRLRERPVIWSMLLVVSANVVVSGCWRAPPPRAASVSAKPWSTCRARSAYR